jgi:hypothetical protein
LYCVVDVVWGFVGAATKQQRNVHFTEDMLAQILGMFVGQLHAILEDRGLLSSYLPEIWGDDGSWMKSPKGLYGLEQANKILQMLKEDAEYDILKAQNFVVFIFKFMELDDELNLRYR